MAIQSYITADQFVNAQIRENPGYVDSVVQQTSWFGSNYDSQESAIGAYDEANQVVELSRAEIRDFEQNYVGIFQARKMVHEENYGFYNSIGQWSEQDKARIAAAGLIPYVSNSMKRYIDTLLGEFAGQKTDWRAIGEDAFSDQKADFMNHLLRSVAQQNDWNRIKAEVVRDGIVGGVGVASAFNDPADPLGRIKLQRHKPYEFMWHVETAKNGSLNDTMYMWRGYYVNRAELEWEFPIWAPQIREFNADLMYQNIPYLETFMRPKVYRKAGQVMDYTFEPFMGRYGRNYIFKREFYRRRKIPKFRISDRITGTTYDFDSKDQADYAAYEMTQYYLLSSASLGQQVPDVPISAPRLVHASVVDQEIWAGETLLAVNHSNEDQIPYKTYIPEFIDGEITSYFEHGKDMQRLKNRLMIFIDMLASGIKGKTVINTHFLPDGWTEHKTREAFKSATEPVLIDSPDPDDAKNIAYHIPPPSYGTLAQQLMAFATDSNDNMFGGLNSIGVTENAGESGKAVISRQQAAAIATIPLREELRYFEREMGEYVCYLSQFMDANAQLLYVDDDGRPEYRTILSDGIQSTADLKFKVQISEVQGSPTEREAQATRLQMLIQQVPQAAPAVTELLLKNYDIDASSRKFISDYLLKDAQAQRDIALSQQRIAEMDAQKKWQFKEAELMLAAKKMQLDELNRPKITLSGKYDGSMPPATAAGLTDWAGYPADPDGIKRDYEEKAAFDQKVIDVATVQRNKLLTPAQRMAEEAKAKKPPPLPSSPKDRQARKNKKK